MDASAIVVVVVLTALSFAALVGMEIYSRKTHKQISAGDPGSGTEKD